MDILEKYALPDGGYEREGIYYDDLEDLLGGRMRFCGCGDPGEALMYILGILEAIHGRKGTAPWYPLRTFFNSDGEMYFVLYMIDSHGFAEHGGSVGGCWLTCEGEEFLEELRCYKKRMGSK